VTPQRWKKEFPELTTSVMVAKKAEAKELRAYGKTLKEKAPKEQNKKDVDKLNRQVKAEAKTAARELVSGKYPKLSDMLKKKNADGVAESLLIALFARNKQDELV